MMIGVKELVENGTRNRRWNNVHLAFWVITFTLLSIATVRVIVSRSWAWPLVGVISAALVFEVLTLEQPPLWIGALLVAGLSLIVSPRPLNRAKGFAGRS